MKNAYTKYEQETIISYNRQEDWVSIDTGIKKDKNKLINYGFLPISKSHGNFRFRIPKDEFTWGRKKKVSEKRRKEASERMKKYNEKKRQKSDI